MNDPTSSPAAGTGRRLLRLVSRVLTSLLVLTVLLIGGKAWRSRTPLPALEAASAPDPRLAAFERGEWHFPEEQWRVADPGQFGWDEAALERARRHLEALDTSSLMVLHRGVPIAMWGDLDRRELGQSMRKGMLNSVIGQLVAGGVLSLDASLADLGIDDTPPLSAQERTATLRHLLSARSGVYRSGLYETGGWKRRRPAAGSASPGEEWFYNNWGLNVLGTVLRDVGAALPGELFERSVAQPLGMEDFRARDVVALTRDHLTERMTGNASDHPADLFFVSTRDLARYGLMMAAGGRWRDQQVAPAAWVEESVSAAQPTGIGSRSWGCLFWVDEPSESFPHANWSTTGGRGHKMIVVPDLELVIVHRIPDGGVGLMSQLGRRFVWHPDVSWESFEEFLVLLRTAHPAVDTTR